MSIEHLKGVVMSSILLSSSLGYHCKLSLSSLSPSVHSFSSRLNSAPDWRGQSLTYLFNTPNLNVFAAPVATDIIVYLDFHSF